MADMFADMAKLQQMYDNGKPLSLDLEATPTVEGSGVYDIITVISLHQEHWDDAIVLPLMNHKTFYGVPLQAIQGIIESAYLVGQNLPFDLTLLLKAGLDVAKPYGDTLVTAKLLYPEWRSAVRVPYSLDRLSRKLCRQDWYAKLDKKTMQKSFDGTPLTAEQIEYAKADVFAVTELWSQMQPMLNTVQRNYDLSIDSTLVTLTKFKGMPVSLDRVDAYRSEALIKLQEALDKLPFNFNPNSAQQTRKLLGLEFASDEKALQLIQARKGGYEGYEYNDKELVTYIKGKLTVEMKKQSAKPKRDTIDKILNTYYGKEWQDWYIDSTLDEIIKHLGEPIEFRVEPKYEHERSKPALANAILKARKNANLMNFCDRAEENTSNGRINATWYNEAVTGRKQPRDENLSQYPRVMKEMWVAPKGRILVYADYSQQELRTICELAGENHLHEAYLNDEDMHIATSRMVEAELSEEVLHYLLDVGIKTRQVAKKLNFLLLYGGGVKNLQSVILQEMGIWIPMSILWELVRNWKQTYPDLVEWQKHNPSLTHTLYGRPMYSTKYTEKNNYQNQGSGADCSQLAMVEFGKVMSNNDDFVNFVHDSFIIETDDTPEDIHRVAKLLADSMYKGWEAVRKGGVFGDTPMPIEVFVGSCWGTIEDEYKHAFVRNDGGDFVEEL